VKAALRWIASNLPLMVLATILAVLAWVVALEEGDPTLEKRYAQAIPVTPSDPPDGMVIVGEFDERAQITVRAPRSVQDALKADDFTVSVDLTGLGAGAHQVPIQVALNKHPSRVILVEPEYVTMEVEPEVEKTVPVRMQIVGEPALGYLMRAPIVVSRQVTVSGPSTYVARVVEAVTEISVQDADAAVEGEFRLRIQDSEGEPVPYVTWTPEVTNVRIPIEPSGYYRALAVKVVLEGQIAPGYRITNISVEPPTVTVFGTPDIIAALPGFIETEAIDVEGAQANVIERPALNGPPDVAIVPGQQPVEVLVSVEAIESSLTVEVTPQLQGLGPGLTATVSPETVEVILSGPLPLLDALEADDVRLVLDLFELPLGKHQIEPQVVVPEGMTAESILPATVQVEIFAAPVPTPTEISRAGRAKQVTA
jgi:YbbR domain-containing protein